MHARSSRWQRRPALGRRPGRGRSRFSRRSARTPGTARRRSAPSPWGSQGCRKALRRPRWPLLGIIGRPFVCRDDRPSNDLPGRGVLRPPRSIPKVAGRGRASSAPAQRSFTSLRGWEPSSAGFMLRQLPNGVTNDRCRGDRLAKVALGPRKAGRTSQTVAASARIAGGGGPPAGPKPGPRWRGFSAPDDAKVLNASAC